MKLKGRTILVTGGTSGIGRALVEALVRRGNRVVTCGRDPARLAALRRELPDVDVISADVTRPRDVDLLLRNVEEQHGHLDVLINNAGVSRNLDLTDPDRESDEVAAMIATNLTAPVQLTVKALPLLTRRAEAAIVNVTSIQAVVGKERSPVYAATKAGLRAFTAALRRRLAGSGIMVIDLMPPLTDTPPARRVDKKKAAPAEVAAAAVAAIERGRSDIRLGQNRWVVQLHRFAPRAAQRIIK